MNTRKVKRHRTSDNKTGNREPRQNCRLGTVSNILLGGVNLFNVDKVTLNICSGFLVHMIRTNGI